VKHALVALALALVACGPAARGTSSRPEAHPVWTQVRGLDALDGRHLGDVVVPGRPAVFIVFATWCGPCRAELAMLGELRAERPDVAIVGLNHYEGWSGRSDEERMRAYVGENAPWLPVVQSDAAMLRALGGVPKIPSLFVFDGEGRLAKAFRRHQVSAPPTLDEVRAALAAAR
jgi:thiol-disulfide isomerase/thioredoxin